VNTYNFEAAGGDYKILVRVIGPNGSDDSLWVWIPDFECSIKHKSPCGQEEEEKARYPQGLECAIY